ncbi:MAG: tetratricopeptide repeat protein [Flavobacteriales bacterium]|nr:tetratricopeptide repeat protein [Flavobacteriales bacterium]
MKPSTLHIILIAVLFQSSFSFSQKTEYFSNGLYTYDQAFDLFKKEKYVAAQEKFDQAITQLEDQNSEIVSNCHYYKALCALELFNKDAEKLFTNFISEYPESQKIKQSYFQLGRYNYRKRKWAKVESWFNKVDIYDLTESQWPEYYFKLGYSLFQQEKFDKASLAFYEIKDIDNDFAMPSKYYFGHIAYVNGKYETAVQEFLKIQNHKKFRSVVPYYIAQIYYEQEKYDELITYAKPILDTARNSKRAPEIARLIGESYYNTDQYKDALPFLELYSSRIGRLSREDNYQMAYTYYQTKNYQSAIDFYNKILSPEDSTSQIIYYQMADSYLKLGEKKSALNAFSSAAAMDYDRDIQEDALFKFAKLTYEMAYDPYQKAVALLIDFRDQFPNSNRAEEAYEYLLHTFSTSKNYKLSLDHMEKLDQKEPRLQKLYQLITYNLGTQYFNDKNYRLANEYYGKSQKYIIDQDLYAQAYYWMGEGSYFIKDYDFAIDHYSEYIFAPRAILQDQFATSHYNLAYCFFQKEDYKTAATWFRKYIQSDKKTEATKINDAYLRIADTYFINGDFRVAAEYYENAMDYGNLDRDYALLQKSIAEGINGNQATKKKLLEELLSDYQQSKYTADAKFQLGQYHFQQNNTGEALTYFNNVVENHKGTSYYSKSLMNIGQIHLNEGKGDMALKTYKEFVDHYPNYNDSRIALDQIKRIYTEKNDIKSYKNYLAKLDFVDISNGSFDSTSYEAPYFKYIDGNCESAIEGFDEYITDVEKGDIPGIFELNARFYRAECLRNSKNYKEALDDYQMITASGQSMFLERATLSAARIMYYHTHDYEKALAAYDQVEEIAEYRAHLQEGMTGKMRCYFKLQNYESAIDYANKVIITDQIDKALEEEAHLIAAKSSLQLDLFDVSEQEFRKVKETARPILAAEATYNLAYIKFVKDDLEQSEKIIYQLVSDYSGYNHWLAKGLMLLSDIYVAKKDYFQAKHTLQSIIDNHEDPGIVNIAKEKLDDIIDRENAKNRQIEERDIELDLFESNEFDIDGETEEETANLPINHDL